MTKRRDSSPDSRGLLSRAAQTPARDFMRLRLTGRLDVRHLVQSSDLPPPLADLVHQVVRATRLWRIERVDVAKELIAHFADGLEAGVPAERLVDKFGDRQQAARLIRRAKKRNRPAWWKTARYGMYTIGCLVLLYAALIVHFALGRPNIARDYVADINARAAAVPQEERAWPLYRQALLALEPVPEELRRFWPDPVDEDDWQLANPYLETNREAIAAIREATTRRGMGLTVGYGIAPEDHDIWAIDEPGSDEIGLIGILLPHLAKMREVAQLLHLDAQRAAREGDSETLVANLAAMMRLAPHLKEHPVIISDLVSIAILSLSFDAISKHLSAHPELFSDEHLVAMAHEIAAAANNETLRMQFEGERMFFADFLQRTFTDDGRGGGRFSPQGFRHAIMMNSAAGAGDGSVGVLFGPSADDFPMPAAAAQLIVGPAAGFVIGNRREQMAKYDEFYGVLVTEASTPLWLRTEAGSVDHRVEELVTSGFLTQIRYLPIGLMMPAIGRASVSAEIVKQKRDGVLVAIALELYRREHGDWPALLSDLTPRYLPRVPEDHFDGRPLRYVVRDGQPIVYSVGTNREDNGGTAPLDPDGQPRPGLAMRWMTPERLERRREIEADMAPDDRRRQVREGDWVLWPRVN